MGDDGEGGSREAAELPACLACLSAPARCELHPCMHRVMCVRCTVSLETAICPACRRGVEAIQPLDGERGCEAGPVQFAEVQRARALNDEATLADTLQVVFAAVPDARTETQALIDAATAAYATPAALSTGLSVASHGVGGGIGPLCGLMRLLEVSRRAWGAAGSGKRRISSPPMKQASSKRLVPGNLPLPNPFCANCVVGGRRARLSLFALPAVAEGTGDVRAVAALLRSLRPDFVFLTATASPRRAARACLEWDVRLRSVLGSAELPRRSWLLVGARDARSTAHSFAPEVVAALDACPVRERPVASLRVASPVVDKPHVAARFARSAVRYAARSRSAVDGRSCSTPTNAPVRISELGRYD